MSKIMGKNTICNVLYCMKNMNIFQKYKCNKNRWLAIEMFFCCLTTNAIFRHGYTRKHAKFHGVFNKIDEMLRCNIGLAT